MPATRATTPWWKRWRGAPRTTLAVVPPQVRVIPWGVGTAPGRVTVKAGRPITLVFVRLDGSSTGELVTIPSLGWVTTLGHAARSAIELAPCAAGAYQFCSLDGVLRGCLVVEP